MLFLMLCILLYTALALSSNDCPEKCELIYQPLCGSNGQTYKNQCQLKRDSCYSKTKIVEIHKGECLRSEDDETEESRQWVVIVYYFTISIAVVERLPQIHSSLRLPSKNRAVLSRFWIWYQNKEVHAKFIYSNKFKSELFKICFR